MTDSSVSSMTHHHSRYLLDWYNGEQPWTSSQAFFIARTPLKHKGCHCFSPCMCNWILLASQAFGQRNAVYVLWVMSDMTLSNRLYWSPLPCFTTPSCFWAEKLEPWKKESKSKIDVTIWGRCFQHLLILTHCCLFPKKSLNQIY